ncbi:MULTISPECIES: COG1361 S-layer family protein [Halobacterium]|uniref:COG1361 S-layer family protein n=1 Tax=Halobacterium TaxID=2239 RepID=UPI0018D25ECD|nr:MULTISPECIES: COG1361 S-layer family protein [Halobacterium]MCG1004953.1 COG1361 S-layer family protein [Halobacterium noricense]
MVVLVVGSIGTAGLSGTVAAQESGEVIGQPNISFATTTGDVSAGKTDTLSLSITNRGKIDKGGPSQYENRVTTARGMTMSLDDENSPIDINVGELAVGNVPTGSSQVDVPITVAESAEPGTYKIPVEYEYQYTRAVDYDAYGAEYSDFTRTQTGSITVAVTEEAQFEVVSEGTNNVFAGDTGNLSFTLKNTGTRTATAASVRLSTQSSSIYFGSRSSASASTSLYVPSLDPGEKTTLSTQVGAGSETAAGSYPADVVVSYRNHNGVIETSDTLTTGVTVRPERSFELRDVSTENFRVDESEARINATIVNTGPGNAQNVAVQLGQTSTVTATNGESSVGDLAVGESASVSFTVSIPASAEPGTNTFPFTVQYENADGDVRTTETPIRKSIMISSERAPSQSRPSQRASHLVAAIQ